MMRSLIKGFVTALPPRELGYLLVMFIFRRTK